MDITFIITVLFGIGYSEWLWSLCKSGERTYELTNVTIKFIIGFNFIVAIFAETWVCLLFAIIALFYQRVIYKERIEKLNGPVA